MHTRAPLADTSLRNICSVLAAFACFIALIADVTAAAATAATPVHPVHHVTGTADQSVTLSCVAREGVHLHNVTWSDKVYNDDESRQSIIFRSDNNAARRIEAAHPNAANYKVDAEFRLTISKLQSCCDVGIYICTSTGPNGAQHERHYDLSVAGKPTCTVTETRVKLGEKTQMSCEMEFASAIVQPTMRWLRDQEPIESSDAFDVGIAKRELEVTATVEDDHLPYRCVTKLGDIENECSVTLVVPHPVQQAQFIGAKRTYTVGEELKCSAKGSPFPHITLTSTSNTESEGSAAERLPVPASAERSGNGWRSIVIPEEWVRKHVTVDCTATNTVDGKHSAVSTSASFTVAEIPTEPPRTAAPTPQAALKGGSAKWSASLISTFVTSLSSLLMATWPIVITKFVC